MELYLLSLGGLPRRKSANQAFLSQLIMIPTSYTIATSSDYFATFFVLLLSALVLKGLHRTSPSRSGWQGILRSFPPELRTRGYQTLVVARRFLCSMKADCPDDASRYASGHLLGTCWRVNLRTFADGQELEGIPLLFQSLCGTRFHATLERGQS